MADLETRQTETAKSEVETTVTQENQKQETVTEKTFTQKDVDRIIKERVGRYSDYEELKNYKQTKETENLSEIEKLKLQVEELSGYKTKAESAGSVIQGLLDSQIESIPEERRSLIPESFDVHQRLDYITKNRELLMGGPKVDIKTPDAKHDTSIDPSLILGKYKSLDEFAKQDPKEFSRLSKKRSFQEEMKNYFNE